jgi:hypothetical protein
VFLVDVLFALVFALLLTGIFTATFRRRGPWDIWWGFLLVIFLGIWAAGLWITPVPFGPTWLTLSWLPALIVGVFLALLLAAATPPQPPRTPRTRRAAPGEEVEETTLIALDVFFWVLVVGMVLSIILAYL